MSAILAVDVGGSGLRARRVDAVGGSTEQSSSEPFRSAGAAITPGGIDLEPLLASVAAFDAQHLSRPDVVVWSMRGLLGLSDPEHVLRQVHSRLCESRTVCGSDTVPRLERGRGEG